MLLVRMHLFSKGVYLSQFTSCVLYRRHADIHTSASEDEIRPCPPRRGCYGASLVAPGGRSTVLQCPVVCNGRILAGYGHTVSCLFCMVHMRLAFHFVDLRSYD
jgi:hypothetical protein